MNKNANASVIGLVDVNNFFVSCERVFMPSLEKKPVLVLSNNDGCVIARSNETKLLGIKMGVPFFQIKDIVKKHNIAVFSSNFSLYGDMSDRVMSTLQQSLPSVEIYSVDEAFLDFSDFNYHDITRLGYWLKHKIHRHLGLPVSIGLAPTKTLAKIANHVAKKWPHYKGVFNITEEAQQNAILSQIAVQDVWGIGHKLAFKLKNLNIKTAYELKNFDPHYIRRKFNRVLEATVLELRGIPCLEISSERAPKKSIRVSRSFSQKINDFVTLRSTIARHVTRACEKLRDQNSLAKTIQVFIETNRFSLIDSHYKNSAIIPLLATDNTSVIIQAAIDGLMSIYRPGYSYQRAGITLLDLIEKDHQQDFFQLETQKKSDPLMTALDDINTIWGSGTLRYGIEGFGNSWAGSKKHKTPAYTTCWEDLPRVGECHNS